LLNARRASWVDGGRAHPVREMLLKAGSERLRLSSA
jgi:hypothetical protein